MEVVTKVDAVGISSRVAIIDASHACPIERTQAHGTGFTTRVNDTTVKLEITSHAASLANGIHFGMGCWVIIQGNTIASDRQHLAISNDDSSKRATATVNILVGKITCYLHEPTIIVGNGKLICSY